MDNDPKAETTEFKGRRILVTGEYVIDGGTIPTV